MSYIDYQAAFWFTSLAMTIAVVAACVFLYLWRETLPLKGSTVRAHAGDSVLLALPEVREMHTYERIKEQLAVVSAKSGVQFLAIAGVEVHVAAVVERDEIHVVDPERDPLRFVLGRQELIDAAKAEGLVVGEDDTRI